MENKENAKKCKYCNAKVFNYQKICGDCYQKLKLVRQIKEIGAAIMKAEREKEND